MVKLLRQMFPGLHFERRGYGKKGHDILAPAGFPIIEVKNVRGIKLMDVLMGRKIGPYIKQAKAQAGGKDWLLFLKCEGEWLMIEDDAWFTVEADGLMPYIQGDGYSATTAKAAAQTAARWHEQGVAATIDEGFLSWKKVAGSDESPVPRLPTDAA